jgi:hypothetical protein
MAKLTMTSSRWDELTELLKDEQRLHAEYPKVAEYLDMAARLAGTGDAQTDAQFDLRFVHYMTGGSAVSANPYWDVVEPLVNECDGRQSVNGGRVEGSARLAFAQMLLQATYAYAIPAPQTIEWIADFCADLPIVEFGAGRGYWAAQLARAGLAVEAYDSEPPDKTQNMSFPGATGQADVWHPVGDMTEFESRGRPAGETRCRPRRSRCSRTPEASDSSTSGSRGAAKRAMMLSLTPCPLDGDWTPSIHASFHGGQKQM